LIFASKVCKNKSNDRFAKNGTISSGTGQTSELMPYFKRLKSKTFGFDLNGRSWLAMLFFLSQTV
jgi:hypothetical protein